MEYVNEKLVYHYNPWAILIYSPVAIVSVQCLLFLPQFIKQNDYLGITMMCFMATIFLTSICWLVYMVISKTPAVTLTSEYIIFSTLRGKVIWRDIENIKIIKSRFPFADIRAINIILGRNWPNRINLRNPFFKTYYWILSRSNRIVGLLIKGDIEEIHANILHYHSQYGRATSD